MTSIVTKQQIAFLILKERTVGLDAGEKARLAAWIAADVQNKQLYDRMSVRDLSVDPRRYKSIDSEEGLKRYYRQYPSRKHRSFGAWQWAAAVAVLIIGITSLFVYQMGNDNVVQEVILPGGPKAVLVLGDGEVIDLTAAQNHVISETGNISIANTGSVLDYNIQGKNEKSSSLVYNELRVPIGGEYMLVMSDGTKVWLNADTKLRYPAVFQENERCVYLEGEAYFEVAKERERPFRVMLKDAGKVEVLGTSFNLSAYNDDKVVDAVLEEGSIRMSSGKDSVVMQPGFRSVYGVRDGMINTTEVSTFEHTAWRKGEFAFHSETVGEIMKKLARWYGVEVVYLDDKAKDVVFSGSVKRYEHITTLLDAMELSGGVRFGIHEHTITVK